MFGSRVGGQTANCRRRHPGRQDVSDDRADLPPGSGDRCCQLADVTPEQDLNHRRRRLAGCAGLLGSRQRHLEQRVQHGLFRCLGRHDGQLHIDEREEEYPPHLSTPFRRELQGAPGSCPSRMNASRTLAVIRDTLLSQPFQGSAWPQAIELADQTAPSFGVVK